jgi:DNA-binding response OmpR family regulator
MAQPTPNILVVEDDRETRTLIAKYLRANACNVATANDGREMFRAMADRRVDLLILDVMLPGEDGLSLCRKVQAQSQTPTIMLTARGEDVDRIVGLELGADDYLPKPFNPRELAARIRAILRRYEPRPPAKDGRIEVNGVLLDPGAREVFADGKRIELTTFEFDILEMLMRSAGRVLSRDALMENFYNRKATPFDRSIDMHISHLRKKLEHGEPLIKTIRGVGYQFCRTPEDARAE